MRIFAKQKKKKKERKRKKTDSVRSSMFFTLQKEVISFFKFSFGDYFLLKNEQTKIFIGPMWTNYRLFLRKDSHFGVPTSSSSETVSLRSVANSFTLIRITASTGCFTFYKI